MTLPLTDLHMDRATLFAALAIGVSLLRYATYFWALHKRTAKPHVFSWFNWGLVVAIGAVAQFKLGGGPSTWVLVVVASTCFLISGFALFVGEKNITRGDWIAFVGALAAIPVWLATESPFWAVVVLMSIDILTYYPTLRKCWMNPWSEPPFSAFWSGMRYFLAIFAVPEPAFQSLIYPVFLMAGDWGFLLYLIWRRFVLQRRALSPALTQGA
ncbi:MAG: hypothetical protein GC134_07385 [Proteobacteria bacterium]|nr:hypothetical protein [Pseudomonadota bacterium]